MNKVYLTCPKHLGCNCITKPFEPIHRAFTLSRMTDKSSGQFLRALAESGGSITCSFTIGSKLPDYRNATMFFMLKFLFQQNLDKFYSFGFDTTEPAEVGF
jgi:hypothetical protein